MINQVDEKVLIGKIRIKQKNDAITSENDAIPSAPLNFSSNIGDHLANILTEFKSFNQNGLKCCKYKRKIDSFYKNRIGFYQLCNITPHSNKICSTIHNLIRIQIHIHIALSISKPISLPIIPIPTHPPKHIPFLHIPTPLY